MWFETSRSVDYVDPDIAQQREAAMECRVRGEGTVDEGQHDDGYAKADRFSEDAQGKGVAAAVGPFVDRVIGGWCQGGKDKCAARQAYSLKATGVRAPSRGIGRPAGEHKDAA